MTKQSIIERTVNAINKLPVSKAEEISDFADFVSQRYEELLLTKDLQQIMLSSNAFDFLKQEEDLYTEADIREKYKG
jgi:hypothetical protein